jgi:hypothetical protein
MTREDRCVREGDDGRMKCKQWRQLPNNSKESEKRAKRQTRLEHRLANDSLYVDGHATKSWSQAGGVFATS